MSTQKTRDERIDDLDRYLFSAATRIRHWMDDPCFQGVNLTSITFTRGELNALRLILDAIGVPASPPAEYDALDGVLETMRDIVFPAAPRN